jgi:hypothetical protein
MPAIGLAAEWIGSASRGTRAIEDGIARTLRARLGVEPDGLQHVGVRQAGVDRLVVRVPAYALVLEHLVERALGPWLDPDARLAGWTITWPPRTACATTPVLWIGDGFRPVQRRLPGEPLRPLEPGPPELDERAKDLLEWVALTGRCTCPMCDPTDRISDLPEVREAWNLLEGSGAPREIERFAAGSAESRQVLSDWLAERDAAPPDPILASLLASRATPRAVHLCERTFYQLDVSSREAAVRHICNTRAEVWQAAEEIASINLLRAVWFDEKWRLIVHVQGSAPRTIDLLPFLRYTFPNHEHEDIWFDGIGRVQGFDPTEDLSGQRARFDWRRADLPEIEGDLDENEGIIVPSRDGNGIVATRYGRTE